MPGGRFSVEAQFKAVDKVTRPVTKMQNRIAKFTRKTRQGVDAASRSFRHLGRDIKSAAVIGVAAMASLVAATLPVVNTTAKFEQSLTNAAAKFPGMVKDGKLVEGQFKALEKVARETGATTEFTASQSAEALNFLAMAGFSAEQAMGALPKVVDLATASQTDLATASDIATDSLGAFGLAVDDPVQNSRNLSRIIDVMAKTTVTANTNMEQLMESVKNGAPAFTQAGQSVETYMALVGEMANAGIKASDSGTTMKNIVTRLTGPVGKAAKILKRLGVETKDADGNMRDVIEIMGDLNRGLEGVGSADRLAAIKEIFGKIPLSGVNVLLAAGEDRLKAYRHQLELASGASAEMAGVMRNTMQGRINTLKSAFESLQITIGQTNSGPINGLITGLTKVIRVMDKAISENTMLGRSLKWVGAILIGVTLLISVFSAVTIAAKVSMFAWAGAVKVWGAVMALAKVKLIAATVATKAWTVVLVAGKVAALAFAKVLAVLTSPITLIIAALAAVVWVGWKVAQNWDALTEKWNNMSTAGKAFIGVLAMMFAPITAVIAGVVGIIKAGQWLVENWEVVKAFFSGFWEGFMEQINGVLAFLKPLGEALMLPFMPLIKTLEFLEEKIVSVLDKLKVVDKIKGIGAAISEGAGDALDFVKTGLGFGDDEEDTRDRAKLGLDTVAPATEIPPVVSPQERIVSKMEERQTTHSAELTVRAEPGTNAELKQKKQSPFVGFNMAPSGAF